VSARAHFAGRGCVTGFGAGVAALVDGVFDGRTVVRTRQRTAGFRTPTSVAAEIPRDVCTLRGDTVDPLDLACRAAEEALLEAGEPDRRGLGLVLATTKADLAGLVELETGANAPSRAGWGLPARLTRALAQRLGLGGPRATVSCACASGVLAIDLAERRIALGAAERMLVVGVDVLTEFVLAGFGALRALDPGACRPFDAARRGVSIGEAACALVLSRHERESLGAHVAGSAGANDACHPTGPDRRGRGVALAARRAVERAGLELGAIDALHMHGTGTVANDATEALGLAELFGGRTPPALGTKAQTGHTLGAAGVVETVIALEMLARGHVPANVGLSDPDVDRGLDLVREPRELPGARRLLKVASGFGGIQGALVVESRGARS